MQTLIETLESCCLSLDLSCNVMKTVCIVFAPIDKSKIVSQCYPNFVLSGKPLKFVNEFLYLGHVISNTLRDDRDIQREMRSMFVRVNMLIRRFSRCSVMVRLRLFRSYCICLYGVGLRSNYAASTLLRFRYCYRKCTKAFFGYSKYHSITSVLLDLKLPSFSTLIHNYRYSHNMKLSTSGNIIVSNLMLASDNLLFLAFVCLMFVCLLFCSVYGCS